MKVWTSYRYFEVAKVIHSIAVGQMEFIKHRRNISPYQEFSAFCMA